MLGRLPRGLCGRWEGEYAPGYPSGRFTWELASGVLVNVRGESVDTQGGYRATLRGRFARGVLILTKTYERGRSPVLVDGRVISDGEHLASEMVRHELRQMAERWAEHCRTEGRSMTPEEIARTAEAYRISLVRQVEATPAMVEYTGTLVEPGVFRGTWAIAEKRLPEWGTVWSEAQRGTWEARRVMGSSHHG